MIRTRLTERFNIDHPVLSAPMAMAGGGALAAAVTNAGGLGFIGGGYIDPDWIEAQFTAAGNTGVGIGFITWRLDTRPEALDAALAHGPRAIFLSFGDPVPHAEKIAKSGVPLICQCQTLADIRRALDAGATAVVAQGGEAGGHGADRGTLSFIPEAADLIAKTSPETLLIAAGGIADGRGLAAALMLGADGVLCGSRFWATQEALTPPGHHQAAIKATGDDTIPTKVIDVARGFDWPDRFRIRVLDTPFIDKWQADPAALKQDEAARADWNAALAEGRTDIASATVGEAVGLIHSTPPAGEVLTTMVREAEVLLSRGTDFLGGHHV